MKKSLIVLSGILILMSCQNNAQAPASAAMATESITETTTATTEMKKEDFYGLEVKDIDGKVFKFSSLKGKKVMIVNTASQCGLTPQYVQLQALYEKFKDNNLVIIGFPANNFASQEPGTDKEIGAFCSKNYGVTFPMMSKISVKGKDMNSVYQFLTQKSKNGLKDSEVEWNFQKYLINENGELENVIAPKTEPLDESIISWINKS